MTRLTRPLDDKELRPMLEELVDELLIGLGLWEKLSGHRKDFAEILGTSVEAASLEEDVRSVLQLYSPHVQRVRVFLLPPTADPEILDLREEVIRRIQAKDSSLPDKDGVVMTVDFATADAFRYPYQLDPERMACWLGRLLVKRAVFGRRSTLLLEFGRDLEPKDWIAIGVGFSPEEWWVQGRRVLLVCGKCGEYVYPEEKWRF
jgi:hypothetical protein